MTPVAGKRERDHLRKPGTDGVLHGVHRVRSGGKRGSSWERIAAKRTARGKHGFRAKVGPTRRRLGWLDQQRRGVKGYS